MKEENKKQPSAQDGQIVMNFYSAMAMIATLVAAATAALSLIVHGKATFYAMQQVFGDKDYDIFVLADALSDEGENQVFERLSTIMLIVLIICAILVLIQLVRAMDPAKKPQIFIGVIATALAIAAMVLFFVAGQEVEGMADRLSNLQRNTQYGLYFAYFVMIIVNTVTMVINVIASVWGSKKYKKTGKTC